MNEQPLPAHEVWQLQGWITPFIERTFGESAREAAITKYIYRILLPWLQTTRYQCKTLSFNPLIRIPQYPPTPHAFGPSSKCFHVQPLDLKIQQDLQTPWKMLSLFSWRPHRVNLGWSMRDFIPQLRPPLRNTTYPVQPVLLSWWYLSIELV